MNIVAFYVLRGKLLVVFDGTNNGIANKCSAFLRMLRPSR